MLIIDVQVAFRIFGRGLLKGPLLAIWGIPYLRGAHIVGIVTFLSLPEAKSGILRVDVPLRMELVHQ